MITYIDNYICYMKDTMKKSASTVKSYTGDITQFITYLDDIGVTDIANTTESLIISYMFDLRQKGRASSTLSRVLASIRSYYTYLARTGFITSNPTTTVVIPKREKSAPQVLSEEEIDRLLDLPKPNDNKGIRDKAILEVLYATGIRVSEIVGLNVGDVNLGMGCVRCKSAKRERIVPMGHKAVEALGLYLTKARPQMLSNPDEQALFVNCSGSRISRQGFWKIIKYYGDEAGIKGEITPHSFRHSFAAHLAENGADLESIREMLGHADISSTKIYAAYMNNKLRDVYEKAHPRAM